MTYVDGEALVRYVVFFNKAGKEVGGRKNTLMMRDKDTIVMESEGKGGDGLKVVLTVIAKNNIWLELDLWRTTFD